MCVYSAYVTEVNKQWPGIAQPWTPNTSSPYFPMLTPTTDPRILQEILDIGRRLDRIDKALGLRDCTQEAAAKKAFEDRLTKLINDAKQLKEFDDGKQCSAPNSSSGQLAGGIATCASSASVGASAAGIALGYGTAGIPKSLK